MSEYRCEYKNEIIQLVAENFDKILSDLDFLCSTKLILAISAGLVSFVAVVAALSICIHRHKWDIRFLILQFVIKRKAMYQELDQELETYEYDAFVAYHSEDRSWIVNELLKNLEGDCHDAQALSNGFPKIRLCIHDRDFIPGLPIQENILRAIDSSRKTILVISQKFSTSSWCEYELQMARFQSIEKGRDIIVAILLEPVDVERLVSTSLGKIIRRNTYLEWNGNPASHAEFWMRLRGAITNTAVAVDQ